MSALTVLGFPSQDRVLVEYPHVGDTSDGGIAIPEIAKANLERGIGRGVIIQAGLRALDVLKSNGWRVGDEVTWGLYSPVLLQWEDDFLIEPATKRKKVHRGLIIMVGDILTNVSAAKRLAEGEEVIVERETTAGLQHFIEPVKGVKNAAA